MVTDPPFPGINMAAMGLAVAGMTAYRRRKETRRKDLCWVRTKQPDGKRSKAILCVQPDYHNLGQYYFWICFRLPKLALVGQSARPHTLSYSDGEMDGPAFPAPPPRNLVYNGSG